MQLEENISIVEAILFASGEPIESNKIAEAAEIKPDSVEMMVKLLNDRYDSMGSSLKVIKLNNSYQIITKEEFAPYIKSALENKRKTVLSPAAMEVLTIVAYNQPVTKSFVENVRGIESSGIVNSLVEKDLLCEAGRLDVPGKPVAFKTTDTFLRCFQLSSLEELPPLPSHNEQVSFNDVTELSEDVNTEEKDLATVE